MGATDGRHWQRLSGTLLSQHRRTGRQRAAGPGTLRNRPAASLYRDSDGSRPRPGGSLSVRNNDSEISVAVSTVYPAGRSLAGGSGGRRLRGVAQQAVDPSRLLTGKGGDGGLAFGQVVGGSHVSPTAPRPVQRTSTGHKHWRPAIPWA